MEDPAEEFEPLSPDNPYAPPPASSLIGAGTIATGGFTECLEVSLVGRPTPKDLKSYLKSEGYVNLFSLICTIIGCLLLLAISGLWGYAAIAITIALCGFVVLTMFVSTMPYRISVFKNLHPNWDLMDAVEVSSFGMTVCYAGSRRDYGWDWFSHAVVGRKVIALIPATQPEKPVLVGKSMLQRAASGQMNADWDAIVEFVKIRPGIRVTRRSRRDSKSGDDAEKAGRNLLLQCSHDRERTVVASPASLLFSGSVTIDDVSRIPAVQNNVQKTGRSKVVASLLVFLIGLLCSGVSEMVFGAFWILSGLYLLYVIAWGLRAGRRSVVQTSGKLCYLQGYASTEHICVDGGVTVSRFPWADLQVVASQSDFMAFQTNNADQYVIVREDMFEMSEHWVEFQQRAQEKSGPGTSH